MAASFDATNNILLTGQFKLRGQRRNACIWFNYTNPLDFDITPFPTLTFNFGGHTVGPFTSGDTNCADCYYITRSNANVVVPNNSNGLNITHINAEGTTQGIGNNWVELNCND